MNVQPVSTLTRRSCSWLWQARLALGKPAILDGDPGLGKSLVALDLCARLSTGQPMPDGTPGIGPTNSLYLSAEDGDSDTLLSRLEALGANTDRVFVITRNDWKDEFPTLPLGIAALGQALERSQARLLVLDPIVAFLDPNILCNADQSIRRALLPLSRLIQDQECSALMLRHLTKRTGQRALYRGGGSIGLIAACRSAWLLAADPADPARRVLAQLKNNLAPPQPSLSLEIHRHDPMPPTIDWLGECPATADELLGNVRPLQTTATKRAEEFLREFLGSGPRMAGDIWHAAQGHDFSKQTLNRARQTLDITFRWVYVDGRARTYWCLPNQQLPEASGSNLERWLKPLREKYPVRTPLEEED